MSPAAHSETINRRPGCVVMELHFDDIGQSEQALSLPLYPLTNLQVGYQYAFEVSLTIAFRGEEPIAIPMGNRFGLDNGKVNFGFQRGSLQLFLENSKMPEATVWLGKGSGQSIAVDPFHIREEPLLLNQPHHHSNVTTLPSQAMDAHQSRLDDIYVEHIGSEDAPIWNFKTQGRQKILAGKLTQVVLGTLYCGSIPCELTARFTVHSEDIRFDWGDGPAAKNIHRNKLAVVQRVLTHDYIQSQIDSYPLSEVTWKYE